MNDLVSPETVAPPPAGAVPDTLAVMEVTARPPIVFASGEGSWLADTAGRRYLDFIQGWAVNCLGHSHPALVSALTRQAATLLSPSPAFYNDQMVRLCTLIAQQSGMDRVFLCNSGAEANEGAIKLARKWGALHRDGAFEIITMDHGFHGRTLATMSASGKPAWESLFEPKVSGFRKVPLNDLAAVEAAIGPRTVAVMLEPIQGEAGVFPATVPFLRGLRALTEQHGLLLILDEIQTGIGRTGRFFAFEHAGIRPDIMTLGKGVGGGVPLAALVATEAAAVFAHGDQGSTFGGNPLAAAAGCAVMETIAAPGFLERVAQMGAYLADRLTALSAKHGCGGGRGQGLLLALDLERPVGPAVVELALARGLLLNAPRPDSLRFMPALTIGTAEVEEMIEVLDAVLGEVTAG